MTCIATAPVSPSRAYQYDTLGRPTSRTLARQGTTRNDVFTYNDRSESPRRLAGGLDKTADGVRRVSLWCSHSPAKQGEGTMGCARSKPRSAFAPQGRAGNGVPASQPTQPVATRPLAIQKDSTWYTYGWDLTKNIWEAYTTTGYNGTAYTYTAYGQVTASGSITQPIQWSSEYNDTELALVYYNYRYYNPVDGRWIGRDPMHELAETLLYSYITNFPIFMVDVLGLADNKICCPNKVVVTYEYIYGGSLEDEDEEILRKWLNGDREQPLNDNALVSNRNEKYANYPYTVLYNDFSENKIEEIFSENKPLLDIVKPIKQRNRTKYHGVVAIGTLEAQFDNKCCTPIRFEIQSGGRAASYNGVNADTTAAPKGKGVISTRIHEGSKIKGFLIRMQKANKWGEWGKNRSELMIHLAPKTGIYGVRQTGSHGCISTKNEEGWKLFVDAMSKCGKETTKIELNIFNNTSIDINAE